MYLTLRRYIKSLLERDKYEVYAKQMVKMRQDYSFQFQTFIVYNVKRKVVYLTQVDHT